MNKMSTKRLQSEYKRILANQPPYIETHPDPDDILLWHFAVISPPNCPYTNGIYYGTITFPKEYPMKPPAIKMLTPSR